MPSLTITTRQTASGARYVVRYRLGGRAYPVQHAGSFRTLKEARLRRDLVAGELAAARNPADLLGQFASRPAERLFKDFAASYRASRVDVADATKGAIGSHLNAILPAFGEKVPTAITWTDVQDWIAGLGVKPSSARRYLATLRLVLDYAGVDPNPARDRRVRLPRSERLTITPPSRAVVDSIIAATSPRGRLLLRTLAETGMRVGEACALEWRDVDLAGIRFRVRHGKTAAARRWIPVPDALMLDVAAATPPDEREPLARVFPGVNANAAGAMMTRACKRAGVAAYSPHDLRHRWISVQVKRGVPITDICAHVGHSDKSLTLDVYSHVIVDD